MPANDESRLQVRHCIRELFVLGLRDREVFLQCKLRRHPNSDRLARQLRSIRSAEILYKRAGFPYGQRVGRLPESLGWERHSLQRILLVEGALRVRVLTSRL